MERTTRALGLLALACLASCVSPMQHKEVLKANEALIVQNENLLRNNAEYQATFKRLKGSIRDLEATAQDAAFVKRQRAKLAELIGKFGDGVDTPKIPGVEAVPHREGVALRVAGGVLFASGRAALSPGGKATLSKLITSIRDHGEIRVDGHTDTDRISRSKWKSNMELSAARAMAVRAFLVSKGVPAAKVGIAGFGEFKPVDPKVKSKNRRVEIVFLR